MAGHQLITTQLALLSRRLPAKAVQELADGLQETYEVHLAQLGDPDKAARAALSEFGDADTITTAFVRASPWRRIAVTLLLTGPIMAVLWGLSLIAAQVWTWPVPAPARIGYGAGLVAVVAILLTAARAQHAYQRTRTAALAGAAGLMMLDAGMLIAIVTVAPTAPWPLALAVPASLLRIIAILRALPTARTA
ncbi:hypothetical protein [Nonomuraea insulae]|uniref:DUF1700 domain-containing protein n=1 Tax=Nonomuraea insulae TaxID=1616787 RepID=A0ABW1CCB9_9ACTN